MFSDIHSLDGKICISDSIYFLITYYEKIVEKGENMVGARIKDYLTQKGIKQTFLAEKTGLTNSVISDICVRGRKVDAVEYYKICKALELPLEYFLEGCDE